MWLAHARQVRQAKCLTRLVHACADILPESRDHIRSDTKEHDRQLSFYRLLKLCCRGKTAEEELWSWVEFFAIMQNCVKHTWALENLKALDAEHDEVRSFHLWSSGLKRERLGTVKSSETESSITVTKKLTFMIINESSCVCLTSLYPLKIGLCFLLGSCICAIVSVVHSTVFRSAIINIKYSNIKSFHGLKSSKFRYFDIIWII